MERCGIRHFVHQFFLNGFHRFSCKHEISQTINRIFPSENLRPECIDDLCGQSGLVIEDATATVFRLLRPPIQHHEIIVAADLFEMVTGERSGMDEFQQTLRRIISRLTHHQCLGFEILTEHQT